MSNIGSPPVAPSLPVLDSTQPHTFIKPLKKINEGHDVPTFLVSKAYSDIVSFLLQLNRAMFPCSISNSNTEPRISQVWELGSSERLYVSRDVESLIALLDRLNSIIDEVPPDPGPRRFGNVSFRRWYEVVESQIAGMLPSYLAPNVISFPHASEVSAIDELRSYFLGSFGSAQRLDYGSGHELSFLAFLGCIWKLGGFRHPSSPSSEEIPAGNEERAIVLHVISTYLRLIRRLIKTYTLEPAGSHGVWGLDDHSFIPYIFGSAQYGPLIPPNDPTPTEGSRDEAPDPGDIAKTAAVNRERDKNMYFGAIGFIHDVKKGPFWEHSPMLYDISGVRAGWGKINKGMIKMYNAEVLSKHPVVQHFPFGSLFPWEPDPHAPPPPISAHTSNQPIRDLPIGVSLETASARAPPPPLQEGTKAPWASKPSATNPPGPNASISTTAPWASSRAPMDAAAGIPPPRLPQSTIKGAMTARMQRAEGNAATGDGVGIPPPRLPQSTIKGAMTARMQKAQANAADDDDDDDDDKGSGASAMAPPPARAPRAKPS